MIGVLLSLLLSTCQAQSSPFLNADFSGGLNTYQIPLLINNNESPDLQNVILDKTGSLDRRQGYIKLNTTNIGDGKHDVNYIFDFEPTNGSKYCLAFSGSTGTYSTDGCQTFTIFVSTLTAGNDVSCDSLGDKAICANNQYVFSYSPSVASSSNVTTAPSTLQYIRKFNNQLFGAGATGNLSRLYYSAINDGTSWNTTLQYIDIAPNDGDVITGIGQPFYGVLPVYKKFSTYVIQQVGANGNGAVFQVTNISPNIGAKNHRSIQTLFTEQLFDSVGPSGGQNGIYAFNGIQVYEKTKKLRGSFDLLATGNSSSQQVSINSQNQFQAGNLCVAGPQDCITATQNAGFMQPSTFSVTDYFSNGTMVNLTTSAVPGVLTLTQNSFSSATLNQGFETGDFTNWTTNVNPTSCRTCSGYSQTVTNVSPLVGIYSYHDVLPTNDCGIVNPIKTFSYSLLDGNGSIIQGPTCVGGFGGALCSVNSPYTVSLTGLSTTYVRIQYTSILTNLADCFFTQTMTMNSGFNTTSSSQTTVYFNLLGSHEGQFDTVINLSAFQSSGIYYSPVFDTAFSTPVSGTFSIVGSTVSGTSLSFSVSQSTGLNAPFSAWTQISTGTAPNLTQEFWKYESSFTTTNTQNTPSLNSVTLVAATTGTWKSAETFTSQSMSSWGLFQTNQNTTGLGSIAYAIQTSTYAGGSKTAPAVVITVGSAITASTGAYVTLIATFTVVSATETAQVSDLTINYSQGGASTTPSSAIFKNRYHYGATSPTGLFNDTVYVMMAPPPGSPPSDGIWVKWTDIRPRSMAIVNQNFIVGDSSVPAAGQAQGYLYNLYNTESDNGNAFSAYYMTKDFPLTNLFDIKSIDKIFLGYKSNATPITIDLISDTGLEDNTYTINMSTTASFGANWRGVSPAINGNTFRLKFSNNAANAPFEILEYGLDFTDTGLMPSN